MYENLEPIELSEFSELKASFFSDSSNLLLAAKFSGAYGRGSRGNGDGSYMVASLAAHCAVVEPVCIILDLSELDYTFGNTILKATNYFAEYGRDDEERDRCVLIVASGSTQSALKDLDEAVTAGNRKYFDKLQAAFEEAEKITAEFMS
ncbi:hypothetical protein OAU50_04345 [Planctomycetota bacterium]|nr:hypothetical protein [Planctomycetota bacterium]